MVQGVEQVWAAEAEEGRKEERSRSELLSERKWSEVAGSGEPWNVSFKFYAL